MKKIRFSTRQAHHLTGLALTTALAACSLPAHHGAEVSVRHSSTDPAAAPFPSDRYTVADATQLTQRRVALPKPDCAVRVTDCADVDVLNTLDGFSVWPRFTVPLTGDIDPASVSSDSVYLQQVGGADGLRAGARVGINQIAWDPQSRTLSFKSDELLLERTRYLLVVTDRVRDAAGRPLGGGDWLAGGGLPAGPTAEPGDYPQQLRQALAVLPPAAGKPVAASLFTTQTATAELAGMARQVKAGTPVPIDFEMAEGAPRGKAPVRALFDLPNVKSMVVQRQVGTAPQFSASPLRLASLQVVPGSVARVGYGQFRSPSYLGPEVRIAPTGTAAGVPRPVGEQAVLVQIFVPAGPKPAGGWPVVLYGHGLGNSLFGSPWSVASVFASHGFATAAINVVGHGGGEQGSLQVTLADGGQVSVRAPGRGVDQNRDGSIGPIEGAVAPPPYALIGARDALRQTVVDLIQLLRQFEAGVDIDGDGTVDFNGRRVFYSGQSFGGVYGAMLLAVEPALVAGVPNVGGGSLMEATLLGSMRSSRTASIASRQPPLINLPPLPNVAAPGHLQMDENLPLRNQPPRTRHVPGALAIAEVMDRSEWAQQSGVATAYAPLLRKRPLPGHAAKPLIYQLAKGDPVMTNTSSMMVVRGGSLADRVSYFRHDLAFAANPAVGRNAHTYLTDIANPAALPHAVAAQRQIAAFFASNGTRFIDADGAQPLFESGIHESALDTLNFLP